MVKKWLLIFLIPLSIFSDHEITSIQPSIAAADPWFTGSLLAASATIVPVGQWIVEPYISYSAIPSRYDANGKAQNQKVFEQVQFDPYIWIGLSDWADLQLNPVWSWNHRDGRAQWVLNDVSVKIDLQLHRDQLRSKSWLPSIKFGFQETFPTGKYNNLHAEKEATDQGGGGSWVSTFELAFGKIFHLSEKHWLQLRFNIDYGIYSSVHLKGLNGYGGNRSAAEVVYPGQMLSFVFGGEYSLTRHWGVACDFSGSFQGKSCFARNSAHIDQLTPLLAPLPSSIQFSLAPAIEYNFSESIGILAGSWFTLSGKNSSKFSNAIVAFNYYYD